MNMDINSILNPPSSSTDMATPDRRRSAPELSSPSQAPGSTFTSATRTATTAYRTSPAEYPESYVRGSPQHKSTAQPSSPIRMCTSTQQVSDVMALADSSTSATQTHASSRTSSAGAIRPAPDCDHMRSTLETNDNDIDASSMTRSDEPYQADSTSSVQQVRVAETSKDGPKQPVGDISKIFKAFNQNRGLAAPGPADLSRPEDISTAIELSDADKTTKTTDKRKTCASPKDEDEVASASAQKNYKAPRKATKSKVFPVGTECMKVGCEHKVEGEDEKNFRTGVLDHFGRNKAQTTRLQRVVIWCRKCYQHASYHKVSWPVVKCTLIKDNLHLVCLDEGCLTDPNAAHVDADEPCSDHCEVTYTITMRSTELDRLEVLRKTYNNDVQAYINAAGDPFAVYPIHTVKKTKEGAVIGTKDPRHKRFERGNQSFIKMPIQILKEFADQFMGDQKTRADCLTAVDWCKAQFNADRIDDIPRFEFILHCPRIAREMEAAQAGKKRKSKKNSNKREAERVRESEDEEEPVAPPSKRAKKTATATRTNNKRKVEEVEENEEQEETLAPPITLIEKTPKAIRPEKKRKVGEVEIGYQVDEVVAPFSSAAKVVKVANSSPFTPINNKITSSEIDESEDSSEEDILPVSVECRKTSRSSSAHRTATPKSISARSKSRLAADPDATVSEDSESMDIDDEEL